MVSFLRFLGAVEEIEIDQLLVRKAGQGTVSEEKRDFIARKKRERWGGGLSAQADAFPTGSESAIAGANAEEKVGLLRSK